MNKGSKLPGQKVRRRQVFYIPGFDPFPPRRYRELYRKEGAIQAAISDYTLAQSAGQGGDSWSVNATMDGHDVQADITVLTWNDLVRSSMGQSVVGTYIQMLRTVWIYVSTGALWPLMRLRKGPVIAAFYPVVFLILQAALAVALFFAALNAGTAVDGGAGRVVGAVLGVILGAGVLELFRRYDGKFYAYYLMHDYAHTAQSRGATPADLSKRLDEFGHQIAKALQGPYDEVLVVGHSSGAYLGVQALARLVRSEGLKDTGPKLAFLTLGHSIPMMSFLPKADELRADLRVMSEQSHIAWVDVTAPGDGCAFALCDPVAVTGVARSEKKWPLVFSAQFSNSLTPESWRAIRWRFFRVHFQYLCAFDRPLDYDYFRITAGPVSLADRYAGRPPSASRKVTPMSRYTSVMS